MTTETFLAMRRTDGDTIGDFTWISAATGDDPWADIVDDLGHDGEDDDPVEIELVRMTVESIEKRTVGGPRPVCDEYEGSELPYRSAWRIMIPESGDPDRWPAGGRAVALTFSDTEDEARAIFDALPDTFFVHHVGAYYSPVDKATLTVELHETEAFIPQCRKCGHPKAAHNGEGAS